MGVAAGVVLLFAGGTAQATPTCTINWTAAGSGNWSMISFMHPCR